MIEGQPACCSLPLTDCYRSLGRAKATLGDLDGAQEAFRRSERTATEHKWYMQALLAGRDWKRACAGAGGAGADEAEAAIEAACAAMGRERAAFAELID